MPSKTSAEEFFRRGKEKGSGNSIKGIDGSVVHKRLTDKVSNDYRRMIDLWNHIDGVENNPDPAAGTVMVYWKQFMVGWRRENDAIPRNITLSVTNFIKYELPEIMKQQGKSIVKNKRTRRYGTQNHLGHLGKQLWGNDWVVYDKPATRVYDWADLLAIVFSSARIGEYIESTCRGGSGRGFAAPTAAWWGTKASPCLCGPGNTQATVTKCSVSLSTE
ncbi:hypothetical protein QBC37DRAFT_443969 [Rhypophila decipiens]|uniref:Uncharacterized protein n=1 Tax=Rhypophila decipiens TaxID=261697 RepID=A0AAN6XX81_9PEZI|nr:hypothetical protein QBC37DRAFT_443969 [Rhypophila decipiens]